MTIPYHHDLSLVPYNYQETPAIVDVATIITDIRTLLVTDLGWTEPSTALFKTPVDAASRFMDVLLTRIAADTLEMRVRDQTGTTVCTRRIEINTGGTAVRYYCNIYGMVIESLIAAQSEILQAHLLDLTPDLQSDHSLYVIGNGYRDSSSTMDSNGTQVGYYYAVDNGTPGNLSRLKRFDYDTTPTADVPLIDVTGAIAARDAIISINFSGTARWAGRICHSVLVDKTCANGAAIKPNIDDDTQCTFRVIGLEKINQMKQAFRCAG
jgi:hypothetical protein